MSYVNYYVNMLVDSRGGQATFLCCAFLSFRAKNKQLGTQFQIFKFTYPTPVAAGAPGPQYSQCQSSQVSRTQP